MKMILLDKEGNSKEYPLPEYPIPRVNESVQWEFNGVGGKADVLTIRYDYDKGVVWVCVS